MDRWFSTFGTIILFLFAAGCSSHEPDPWLSKMTRLDPARGWEILLQDPVYVAFNRHPERDSGGMVRELAPSTGELGPERFMLVVQGRPTIDWQARYETVELIFSGILQPISVDPLGVAMRCRLLRYDEAIPDGREVKLLAIRGITRQKVAEAIYPR